MLNTLINYSVQSMGLIPILAFIFLLGISIIVERFMFFSRAVKAGKTLEHDLKMVEPTNLSDAQKVAEHYGQTVQGELVKSALKVRGKPEAVVERELEETIMFQMPRLDRNLWILDTAVTLGPLLGLLGTIIGMVESFNVLGTSGTANPNGVTGGIGHALTATACGLTIAIVCVIFLNYFNKRIRMTVNQFDLIKSLLVSRFAA
ncbi:MotA/TolQ/ExbB proton channel family protein [bacterium M00.F.Ca.ET.228.01.1.1]|uniref:MotA/TolQ/ExbB proton channel family protein n=1 Tax=Paraburkholderia phenoliruptrix TaxID=252970 RepID=UPI001092087A|nr:MotA/TolQ/ExbB proton channel family protein [Paraburkholderia phenoliruptrix]MBW9100178.1 MotA/TolQ/ExbB proton channel family protein [Paraburkholderia phenoliruptrix]TGP39804.1 MotA/TolQ/ExbB proton channel family protein [bacterium M00.F.Ca.ET.228.01.1.1]TGR95665.1 MotA/TolQ/ExbB proton channel family protein [bacterium M00.F.Ca.ET.191.01.1.1]TGT96681.1 MotA/TolQ/ExbB proton channel family protein [bacterium M00.F.Ca.ET.155.01.1.1]